MIFIFQENMYDTTMGSKISLKFMLFENEVFLYLGLVRTRHLAFDR